MQPLAALVQFVSQLRKSGLSLLPFGAPIIASEHNKGAENFCLVSLMTPYFY